MGYASGGVMVRAVVTTVTAGVTGSPLSGASELGSMEHVVALGTPLQLKEMASLKPPVRTISSVYEAAAPAETVLESGEAETEKSEVSTPSGTETCCDPLVAPTVKFSELELTAERSPPANALLYPGTIVSVR